MSSTITYLSVGLIYSIVNIKEVSPVLKVILPNQVNDPFEWDFQENPNLLVTGDNKINKTSVLSKLILSASSLENSSILIIDIPGEDLALPVAFESEKLKSVKDIFSVNRALELLTEELSERVYERKIFLFFDDLDFLFDRNSDVHEKVRDNIFHLYGHSGPSNVFVAGALKSSARPVFKPLIEKSFLLNLD